MKISIYTYRFPPDLGVGGRRWGIFAEQLAQKGHEITITTPRASNNPDSFGTESLRRSIHFRNIQLPLFPKPFGADVWSRIRWQLMKIRYMLNYRGWFWDPTVASTSEIKRLVHEDILGATDVIIVTCAPFRWSLYIGEHLKRSDSSIKYIIDLRDPWSKNKLAYFTGMSPSRLRQEIRVESKSVKNAHGIIVAHEPMCDHYKTSKVLFLPNNVITPRGIWTRKPIINEIRLIFPGTLYSDGYDYLRDFLQKMISCCEGRRVILTTLGKWDKDIILKLQKLCHIENLGHIPSSQVPIEIQKSHYVVSYVSSKLPYAINTKILEAIECETPIFLLGNHELSEFLEVNNVGFDFTPEIEKEELRSQIFLKSQFGPMKRSEFDRNTAVGVLMSFIKELVEEEI